MPFGNSSTACGPNYGAPVCDRLRAQERFARNHFYSTGVTSLWATIKAGHRPALPSRWNFRKALLLACLLTATAFITLVTSVSVAADEKTRVPVEYRPVIHPADFTNAVDNPYFPLVPGTTFTFLEKDGRESRENKTTVTDETKIVMGVKCVVVHDTVTLNGVLLEDTFDWYAQDKHGNVWYFGEATKAFKSGGRVSTEGSWEAGVKGAKPGIIMQAHPQPGEPYRQEYLAGEAEDMGQVIAVGETVTVPYGTMKDCVQTKDWSLLEPGSEKKWYAKGVGLVRAESTSGEVLTLISVTKQ